MTDTTTTTAPPAGATTPPPTTTTAPPTTQTTAPQWFDQFQDPSLKQWVQGAGIPDPEQAAAKAWNLEKMLGADRAGRTVVLPADPNDADAMAKVFDRLGRPPAADGYKLPIPDGADPAFAKQAAQWFHAAGLTAAQAENVAAKWNEHTAKVLQDQAAAEAAALQAEHAALAQEWGTGPAAQEQRELARRAAQHMGLDEAAIDALEKATGFSKTMKAFAKVGAMLAEAKAEGFGEGSGNFSTTPEAAKGRKAQLMADPEWRKRAMNPKSAEWAELQRLDTVIAASQGPMG